jgi:hypothetical protein
MYRPDRYPRNWRALAIACKTRANWQCERCPVKQRDVRISKRTKKPYTVFLHAAHVKLHDAGNPDPQLQALCPTCHALMDWQHRRIEQRVESERIKHRILLSTR